MSANQKHEVVTGGARLHLTPKTKTSLKGNPRKVWNQHCGLVYTTRVQWKEAAVGGCRDKGEKKQTKGNSQTSVELEIVKPLTKPEPKQIGSR